MLGQIYGCYIRLAALRTGMQAKGFKHYVQSGIVLQGGSGLLGCLLACLFVETRGCRGRGLSGPVVSLSDSVNTFSDMATPAARSRFLGNGIPERQRWRRLAVGPSHWRRGRCLCAHGEPRRRLQRFFSRHSREIEQCQSGHSDGRNLGILSFPLAMHAHPQLSLPIWAGRCPLRAFRPWRRAMCQTEDSHLEPYHKRPSRQRLQN
jgi:hypothetical protein